jgi:hypothetical protein
VKGHNGHPENERCDELAMSALNSNNLLADVGYVPLFCPSCKTMYLVEDAKREIDNQGDNLFT